MNDFKKHSKPGGFSRGGARPSFGGTGARRSFGDSETFKATCSKCHKTCDVPFKPNGKKPVFCRDCFVRDDARPSGNSFEKRSYAPERSQPQEDLRIGAIQKELSTVHAKLDALIASLEGAAYASILEGAKEKPKNATKKTS